MTNKNGYRLRSRNNYPHHLTADSAYDRNALTKLLDDIRQPLGREFVVEGMMGLVGFVQKAAIQRSVLTR